MLLESGQQPNNLLHLTERPTQVRIDMLGLIDLPESFVSGVHVKAILPIYLF